MIISTSLFSLNSYGTVWRSKLAETLRSLGYNSSEADADLWMNQDLKPNGYVCYKGIYVMFMNFST